MDLAFLSTTAIVNDAFGFGTDMAYFAENFFHHLLKQIEFPTFKEWLTKNFENYQFTNLFNLVTR